MILNREAGRETACEKTCFCGRAWPKALLSLSIHGCQIFEERMAYQTQNREM